MVSSIKPNVLRIIKIIYKIKVKRKDNKKYFKKIGITAFTTLGFKSNKGFSTVGK